MPYFHYSNEVLSKDKLYDDLSSEDDIGKPTGLWLSCNNEWKEFVDNSGMKELELFDINYEYEVEIDDSKLLKINTYEDLMEFINKYKINKEIIFDWTEVKKDYDGIIFNNYRNIKYKLLSDKNMILWYYAIDINCACIWRPTKVVKKVILNNIY